MSESRVRCPLCDRAPGSQHDDFCPRSAVTMHELTRIHKKAQQGIHFWSKGPIVVRLPGEEAKITYNPGIPYVRQTGGKPWTAGGVPFGMKEQVDAFKRSLGMKVEK